MTAARMDAWNVTVSFRCRTPVDLMWTSEVEAAVRNAALFRSLDAAAVDRMVASGVRREIPPGGELLRQGDPPGFLYLVVKGRLKITHATPRGERLTLRVMGPGELVGCAAVFRRSPYPASAVAVTEAVVLGWGSAQVLTWIHESPVLARNALETLGGRVEELLHRVRELASEPVERRLARTVLRLMGEGAKPAGAAGFEISFAVTRQDLAELTGATHFTVSRILSKWAKDKVVSRGRQRILIRDVERLAAIARH